ncbi:uncharacterized protein BCR38DRAFT_450140 [Pseudomassariella vexata]|uniref:Uncharacterized protein n=1 Tax=Pseudomassariella vexata TaxID=1141098 RepID=A0A1Y2DDE0_9PEZI|nr:uncharacterized protein BCR38DRAFT_450140 [Pseudomassariella vexata]ORY57302.1 hypothetical protein BCR38DRAFT_450140 [Pseudomassariella vexata]
MHIIFRSVLICPGCCMSGPFSVPKSPLTHLAVHPTSRRLASWATNGYTYSGRGGGSLAAPKPGTTHVHAKMGPVGVNTMCVASELFTVRLA